MPLPIPRRCQRDQRALAAQIAGIGFNRGTALALELLGFKL